MSTNANGDGGAPAAVRIYQSAADGQRVLQSRYEYWTAKINDHSFNVSVSLIAANGAVYSPRVSTSVSATSSIALARLTLLLSLGGALRMSLRHYSACYGSVNEQGEWARRWKDAETNKASPWPFTHDIISLGVCMAWSKVVMPCASTIFFLIGAIC